MNTTAAICSRLHHDITELSFSERDNHGDPKGFWKVELLTTDSAEWKFKIQRNRWMVLNESTLLYSTEKTARDAALLWLADHLDSELLA